MLFKRERGTIGIIGLGYVGLPLAMAFIEAGYKVRGIEADRERANMLWVGHSYVPDVSDRQLQKAMQRERLQVDIWSGALHECEAVLICVPTPIDSDGRPNGDMVRSAMMDVVRYARRGVLVVVESTLWPGGTVKLWGEAIWPYSRRPAWTPGEDCYLGYSPERIDPGRNMRLRDIPKVAAGLTPACADRVRVLYGNVFRHVHMMPTLAEAEAVKLLENVYRAVNIGLVNEFARIAETAGIDMVRVVQAAATKPYGFQPFYPGPGLGGPCLRKDAQLAAWWAQRVMGRKPLFPTLALCSNDDMLAYWMGRVHKKAQAVGFDKSKQVVVVGVGYKPGVGDIRDSPGVAFVEMLVAAGYNPAYYDPRVPELWVPGWAITMISLPSFAAALEAGGLFLVTDNTLLDWGSVPSDGKGKPFIFTRGPCWPAVQRG